MGYPPTAKLSGLALTDLVAHSGPHWLARFRPISCHWTTPIASIRTLSISTLDHQVEDMNNVQLGVGSCS